MEFDVGRSPAALILSLMNVFKALIVMDPVLVYEQISVIMVTIFENHIFECLSYCPRHLYLTPINSAVATQKLQLHILSVALPQMNLFRRCKSSSAERPLLYRHQVEYCRIIVCWKHDFNSCTISCCLINCLFDVWESARDLFVAHPISSVFFSHIDWFDSSCSIHCGYGICCSPTVARGI